MLGVTGKHQLWSWGKRPPASGTAATIAEALEPSDRQRLSAGAGTKGERLDDWAYLELADLPAAEFGSDVPGVWTRGLLVRRTIADDRRAFFTTTWCPAGTGIATLVRVEGARWTIDRGWLRDRQDRARSRPRRDAVLARLAPPRLPREAGLRQAGRGAPPRRWDGTPQKPDRRTDPAWVRRSVQEIRRVSLRLALRRIEPAFVIAWSAWRRAHQAAAQTAPVKRRAQL